MKTTMRRMALAAAIWLLPGVLWAQTSGAEIPVTGGTAAMARALGIDTAPDRPRFLAELIRVVYDAREGKNVEVDAKLARLTSHLEVAARFQSALATVQPRTSGVALAMATAKDDRNRLKDFLDLIGLKLREKNKVFSVERTDNKQAAERVKLLSDLGIDLGKLAARLNAGEIVRIEVPTETVPAPLPVKLWSDAIFQRPVAASELFGAIMADRRAALVAHGLAALDDETLRFLSDHPAILTRLYEHEAASFAAFGDALRIRDGRVVPPGGAEGIRVWEAVLDEKVARPDRFIRELFGASQGRVALLYETLSLLDPPHVRFALGAWLPDANARVEQFKKLVSAEIAREEFDVNLRPFGRPVSDPSILLTRVRVMPNGAPAPPAARLFWERAFESADLPDDPARRLRNMQDEGTVDAGWLAETMSGKDMHVRADRLDQLAFGQRAFAAVPDRELPNALVAVRALTHFRMLILALDRMGVRSPAVYAAAAHQADRLATLDGRRALVALGQFQGALAVLERLVVVHSVKGPAAEALVTSLSAAVLNDDGQYAGGVARWIDRELATALAWTPGADVDALLIHSLAGQADPDAGATKVTWEGRPYRVDLVTPEQRRLTRVREKIGSPPLRLALEIEHVATTLSGPSVSQAAVTELAAALKNIASVPTPKEKKAVAVLPPGVDPPKNTTAEIANKAAEELSKIKQPKDLKKAAHAAAPLFALSDELVAQALMSTTYALYLGSPEGTTLLGGDASRRHDFGLDNKDGERRKRAAWAAPTQATSAGAPWHGAGSLLGLDAALASLALRRIDTGDVPPMPVLTMPDRETFTKTLVLLNPFDLTDAGRDAIVAALGRGRARVALLAQNGTGWDEAADEIRMDGWRRRAGRWAITNDHDLVPSFFSLAELVHLGQPPPDAPLDRWGMASDSSDACVCTEAPLPGRATLVSGRPQLGLLASEVADVNLRVAEMLGHLHLPASLARGVLAAAVQDFVDQVKPIHPSDWLTLVRTAQAIPDDRLEDYVAALTADGPLVPERGTAGADRGAR